MAVDYSGIKVQYIRVGGQAYDRQQWANDSNFTMDEYVNFRGSCPCTNLPQKKTIWQNWAAWTA